MEAVEAQEDAHIARDEQCHLEEAYSGAHELEHPHRVDDAALGEEVPLHAEHERGYHDLVDEQVAQAASRCQRDGDRIRRYRREQMQHEES